MATLDYKIGGISNAMLSQMLKSDVPEIRKQAEDIVNKAEAAKTDKSNIIQKISDFFGISQAGAAEPDRISSVSSSPGFKTILKSDGTISNVPVDTSSSLPFLSMATMDAANQFPILPASSTLPLNAFKNTVAPMGVNTGIMTQVPNNTSVRNVVEDEDIEASAIPKFEEGELKQPFGIENLLSFLPFGENSILGRIGQGISNKIKGSSFYSPATTGVFGYTPQELNQMNALGGYYSDPMREFRRRSNRISNMMRRAAEGKSYSQKNLSNLMNQFDMGDVDTKGMIDSIKASADLGYGRGDVGQAATPGRDYSSSPGAMAGDMEYGEE